MTISCSVAALWYMQGDANALIALKVVESAQSQPTNLMGSDTDLLVLLIHYYNAGNQLWFKAEPKKKSAPRTWNLVEVRESLGNTICMHILFIHAILGCDTTSSVHGIGKGASLQMLSNPNSLEQANIFNKPMNDVSQEEVVVAGEKALLYLYNMKNLH